MLNAHAAEVDADLDDELIDIISKLRQYLRKKKFRSMIAKLCNAGYPLFTKFSQHEEMETPITMLR
jgi:hypothetical protein